MKRKQKYDYQPYPAPQQIRVGCKVSWHYYEKEEDAKAASKAAVHNAEIQASQGYDFGYCAPGSITKDQLFFPGLYEVCLP